MKKKISIDELLRRFFNKNAPTPPDPDELWGEFEGMLAGQNPFKKVPFSQVFDKKPAMTGVPGYVVLILAGLLLLLSVVGLFLVSPKNLKEKEGATAQAPAIFSKKEAIDSTATKGGSPVFQSKNVGPKLGPGENPEDAFAEKKGPAPQNAARSRTLSTILTGPDSQNIEPHFDGNAPGQPGFSENTVSQNPSFEAEKPLLDYPRMDGFEPLIVPKPLIFNHLASILPDAGISRFQKTGLLGKRQGRYFHLFAGMELDGRSTKYNDGYEIPLKRGNVGFGMSQPLGETNWRWRAELWRSQISVPEIRWTIVSHGDLDSARVIVSETRRLQRMSGFSTKFLVGRPVWRGFRVNGGLFLAYYPNLKWDVREKTLKQIAPISTNYSKYPAPASFSGSRIRKWQAGASFSLEKHLFKNVFLGASMTQNLVDYTKNNNGGNSNFYHTQRDYLVYLGFVF